MRTTLLRAETTSMWLRFFFASLIALTTGASWAGAQIVDQGNSVEGCVGCHAEGRAVPVGNVNDTRDPHYIDLDSRGPATSSGYRQLKVAVTSVNVMGSQIVVGFSVTDENDEDVDNIFDADGRLVVARVTDTSLLNPPATAGDPTEWDRLVSEHFTTNAGGFQHIGGAAYSYTTAFDPTTVPIVTGDNLRAAVEISAGDIPAGNGWCDFSADTTITNSCTLPPSLTRNIVETATCNGCHGVTSDTKLAFHGNGGRTDVEYCVTCHNPPYFAEEMTTLIHKIHYGAELTQPYRGGEFDHVVFTRDIDNCTSCHAGNGSDVDNWKTQPNRTACGSCHDDVNFDTGENHGSGGPQADNRLCRNCHPSQGDWTLQTFPIPAVHQGVFRSDEAGLYRGDGNGYAIDASYDRATDQITVDFSVTRDGQKMLLQSDPRWSSANGGRLAIQVAWSSEDYTNEGSGSTPAPAQPVSVDALDVGGAVTEPTPGNYRAVIDKPAGAFDNATVALEGHPVADTREAAVVNWESIPVRSAFKDVNVEPRGQLASRRHVVDMAKCNTCHDADGAGLSLHGNNRAGEAQVCVLCHNGDATDISRRPPDPAQALDGKREESIDFKRMIHQIHMGRDLQDGIVVYGFSFLPGTYSPHDYSEVGFVGNSKNCLTCHEPGTYSADAAWHTVSTTVDTGADVTIPSDDLNISPVTSVCSSCHDTDRAKEHMVANGGTFGSLDANIAIAAVPEPLGPPLPLAALGALGFLARRRLLLAPRRGGRFRATE